MIIERGMEYHGSKSITGKNIPASHKPGIVKEQRVDGSSCINSIHLRYTLMGFERNYQVKIPSNQIIQCRSYISSIITSKHLEKDEFSLNPSFVTGFIDGEGCFFISITRDNKYSTGWHVKPGFQISLLRKLQKDLPLLQQI